MDIVDIGTCRGQKVNFLDQAHESMKKRCERYQEKSDGPYYIYKELGSRTPIQYVEEAFDSIKKYKDNIGVVIDASTTRGFAIPSAASLYSQHLGIKPQQAFDLSQACNGWAIATEQALMMFECDEELQDKYILIINNEQPPEQRAVLPESSDDYKGVASYFVGLTFSAVCTCTLLKKSQNYSWDFVIKTNPQYASHISIPLPKQANAKGYLPDCKEYEVDLNDQYGQFCIPKLHQMDQKIKFIAFTLLNNLNFSKTAHYITHTFTKKVYEHNFYYTDLGKLSLYYDQTGNLGSCSLPFILWDNYYQNGQKMNKGQRVTFIGNAAGGADAIVMFEHEQISKNKQIKCTPEIGIFKICYTTLRIGMILAYKKVFCQKRNYILNTASEYKEIKNSKNKQNYSNFNMKKQQ